MDDVFKMQQQQIPEKHEFSNAQTITVLENVPVFASKDGTTFTILTTDLNNQKDIIKTLLIPDNSQNIIFIPDGQTYDIEESQLLKNSDTFNFEPDYTVSKASDKQKPKIQIEESIVSFDECNLCNYKFINKVDFEAHKRTHSKELSPGTDVHELDQSNESEFESSNAIFVEEGEQQVDVNQFHCNMCVYKFTNKFDLEIHRKAHMIDQINKKTSSSAGGRLKSNVIKKAYSRRNKRKTAHFCEICNHIFYCRLDLVIHKKIHQSLLTSNFRCHHCDKEFSASQELFEHLKLLKKEAG